MVALGCGCELRELSPTLTATGDIPPCEKKYIPCVRGMLYTIITPKNYFLTRVRPN